MVNFYLVSQNIKFLMIRYISMYNNRPNLVSQILKLHNSSDISLYTIFKQKCVGFRKKLNILSCLGLLSFLSTYVHRPKGTYLHTQYVGICTVYTSILFTSAGHRAHQQQVHTYIQLVNSFCSHFVTMPNIFQNYKLGPLFF